MLHPDVLMADIDVDQWRNAQALLLRSAKAAPRLVVIHDNGTVQKFRHTQGIECAGRVETLSDPAGLARSLYEQNEGVVDFVVVMERHAVDDYFSAVQDSWRIDEDLDVFVQRTYETLDDYPEGIVTYPGPARKVLGLQWLTGSSLAEVNAAAAALPNPSTVILGVHDGTSLTASLVLDLDADHQVTSITTADPTLVEITGTRESVAAGLLAWQQRAGKQVSLSLILDQAAARDFLATPTADKGSALATLIGAGRATYVG
ncbi:MAG: hypothetical protein ACK5KO_10065 [Arachnia sp.]